MILPREGEWWTPPWRRAIRGSVPNDKQDDILRLLDVISVQVGANHDATIALGVRVDGLALGIDRIERRLGRLEVRIEGVEIRLDRVEARLDRVEVRLDRVEVRLDRVDVRLDGIESELRSFRQEFERRVSPLEN